MHVTDATGAAVQQVLIGLLLLLLLLLMLLLLPLSLIYIRRWRRIALCGYRLVALHSPQNINSIYTDYVDC